MSVHPAKRIRCIETQSGKLTTRQYVSVPLSNAYSIESDAHKHFSHARMEGEWFSVSFDAANDYLVKADESHGKRPDDANECSPHYLVTALFHAREIQRYISEKRGKPIDAITVDMVKEWEAERMVM